MLFGSKNKKCNSMHHLLARYFRLCYFHINAYREAPNFILGENPVVQLQIMRLVRLQLGTIFVDVGGKRPKNI